jgi:hypothetical protein
MKMFDLNFYLCFLKRNIISNFLKIPLFWIKLETGQLTGCNFFNAESFLAKVNMYREQILKIWRHSKMSTIWTVRFLQKLPLNIYFKKKPLLIYYQLSYVIKLGLPQHKYIPSRNLSRGDHPLGIVKDSIYEQSGKFNSNARQQSVTA